MPDLIGSSKIPENAMIFAAGLGTRMRPITDHRPKPLVEVGGKTLLDHVLDNFAQAGVKRAIVNVHYLPDMIIGHLQVRQQNSSDGLTIEISDESALLLDQGGGIGKVLDRLGNEAFFIANTDSFWVGDEGVNLQRMADRWNPQQMDILLLQASVERSIGVDWKGDFFMDGDGRLTRRGAHAHAPHVYAGVGLVKPSLFRNESAEKYPLSPIFDRAGEQGRLFGLELNGLWLHVGTPQAIDDAEQALSRFTD